MSDYNACPKCRSSDLLTVFTPKNAVVAHSAGRKIEDQFITSNEYDFFWQHKAAKDHLRKHCRNCQYQWRENTADEVTK